MSASRAPRAGDAVVASPVVELTRRLERAARPGGPFHPAALAALDRAEEFPAAGCSVLDDFGLHEHYVPAALGGRLHQLTDVIALLRAVARHDLTTAVAHGKTLLGAASLWVAAGPEQAKEAAAAVLDGSVLSWALTERDHGSDLFASELTATPVPEGLRLDGEKWLINNATRGDRLCVLARTSPEGGARGFSVLLVDKRTLPAGSHTPLAKCRTHGIRGADISGIAFHGATVPASALVGAEGTGLETVLKALQLTRTVCTALSLGAADHGLRLAVRFTVERELYGRTLAELPRVRQILGDRAGAMLLAEAVAVLSARSAQTLPGELSAVSALAKAYVPTSTQATLDAFAELLGVRSFLTEAYADGMFPKLERDHRVVGIFDGSTLVNRSALIEQFGSLVRGWKRGWADLDALGAAAALDRELPEFDPHALRLISSRGCGAVQALPVVVRACAELAGAGLLPAAVVEAARRLAEAAEPLHEEMAALKPGAGPAPTAAFHLAERYEALYAGAACLWLAVRNPDRLAAATAADHDRLWHDARWIRAALGRALHGLGAAPGDDAAQACRELGDLLIAAPEAPLTLLDPSAPAAPARGEEREYS
ncbi:acyl-CoA dehydrogenase family protein [Streptomyces badius]